MNGVFGQGVILLGKYRVESVLGQGGMGVVLRVTHLHLGEELAVKVLLPEGATRPEVATRFLREAQAVVRLRGEHVARVGDVGVLPEGLPYMVMEYLRGIDLAGELERRGALPPGEAVDYALQVCEALAEAHAQGIVHRDIKPANLFLTARPDGSPLVKVLDFGISKTPISASDLRTNTQVVMGTPGYMSPEQMRATWDVDARTDIWALGIVLYECLAGRRPFDGDSYAAIVLTAGIEPPRPLGPRVPRGLQAAVLRCLAKDRKDRYQTIAAVTAALAPFARNQRDAATIVERTRLMLGRPERAIEAEIPTNAGTAAVGSRARRRRAIAGALSLAGSVALLAFAALMVLGRLPVSDHRSMALASSLAVPARAARTVEPEAQPAVAVALTTAPARPAAAQPARCNELAKRHQWRALAECAEGLAAAGDPEDSRAFRDLAALETTSELLDHKARQALSSRNLREAQVLIRQIAPGSIYYRSLGELFGQADALKVEEVSGVTQVYVDGHDCPALRRYVAQNTATIGTEHVMAVFSGALAACRGGAPAPAARRRLDVDGVEDPFTSARSDAGNGPEMLPILDSGTAACETFNVEEAIRIARILYNAGKSSAALSLMTKALACRPDDATYRMAALCACHAHDAELARRYASQVSAPLRSNVEQVCQSEGIDLASRSR